jgi:ketosteroid isomerase-like protein
MVKRFLVIVAVTLACAALVPAQSTESSTAPSTRTRVVAPKPSPTPRTMSKSTDSEDSQSKTQKAKASSTPTAPSTGVLAAFDKIIEGVKRANVDMATSGYWKSPALILFNYNGSVTRGWDQMRKNRELSYPDIKDVKLDVRDKHVIMLGRDGAVVMCLWSQSQTYKGQPDSASGRMTLVFKRVGNEWKAVHLHTSPDKPDASRIPSSEQTTTPPQ